MGDVPKEAKLVSLLLSSAGIGECQPKVIHQIIEFIFRTLRNSWNLKTYSSLGYVTDVLQESVVYSEHAGKSELDLEDLRLGIKGIIRNKFSQPLSRDVHMSSSPIYHPALNSS